MQCIDIYAQEENTHFGTSARPGTTRTTSPPAGIADATATEPFSSGLCLADLQNVNGLGELPGAPEAAAKLAEDAPELVS